ncbi:Protein of unknown function [Cotesia congregata]|uniref:Uncharacterized protein n=1 Tax=Cotesia congregata TaxID=51543 RepID=A0A8J2HMW1_COTCN|nr:Protein of unknown function [Cotesia congregata]
MADRDALPRQLLLLFVLLLARTCWWNEVCKEEFHSKFRCRCPRWSYCRAPGKYYDAHCSITRTGYIWTQPEMSLATEAEK